MVKADQQTEQAALAPYSKLGGYVPRFFFLNSDGSVNTAINSGHARFPYFFHSKQVGGLKAAMRRALGG